MSLKAEKKLFYTPAEYLALEENAEYRSEYLNGNIFKMAGGSEAHIQISFNVTKLLADKLRGQCRAYQSEMKVWVEKAGTFFYPDVTVVCGAREFHKNRQDAVENPILLVEVLSKSTKEYDANDKFIIYQNIPTFREYILIDQHKFLVQQFIRQDDESWKYLATIGQESTVQFVALKVSLAMREIYDLVEFN